MTEPIPHNIDNGAILVIGGSVRRRRISPQIAKWVASVGQEATGQSFEVIDLAEWPLPMDDEQAIPSTSEYEFEHTRAWSRKVAGAPAFVFVTPQYNGGYPAALKNAIDHLFKEWGGKPAMIVTYGGHGGGYCGEQLNQVCRFLRMEPVAARPALVLPHGVVEANLGEIEPASTFAAQVSEVRTAFIEFAEKLQARSKS